MRLLDRYLLRELLVPLGYCLSGFFVFWISFDLLSELAGFQEDGVSAPQIAWYYLFKAPELLVVVLPVALLLALLYALTNHARHHELTAMRAAGLSLSRLSLPYLGVGLACSIMVFGLNEFWVPTGNEAARGAIVQNSGQVHHGEQWARSLHFRNARDGRIWNIGAFNTVTFDMEHPQVEWSQPDRRTRFIARSAVWTNDCWVFQNVQEIITFSGKEGEFPGTHTNVLVMRDFSETPQQIKSEIKISRLTNFRTAKDVQLSIREILEYLRIHPDLNARDRALLDTKLQERFAAPWTCIVVVLIALPFGAISSRRSAFGSVASSVFICFGFFILMRFGLALATGGYIPSWVGAWLPNGLFAAAGLWMTRRAP
ncbi:MAG: LptF/LptG family permease [Verrucomicrobiota bacterium]